MVFGRAAPLGVEIDAVVVRVPSHVVPVRKGCHRQRRRHLHALGLGADKLTAPLLKIWTLDSRSRQKTSTAACHNSGRLPGKGIMWGYGPSAANNFPADKSAAPVHLTDPVMSAAHIQRDALASKPQFFQKRPDLLMIILRTESTSTSMSTKLMSSKPSTHKNTSRNSSYKLYQPGASREGTHPTSFLALALCNKNLSEKRGALLSIVG